MWYWVAGVLMVLVLPALALLATSLSARPKIVGVIDGHLADCPPSPNCVASRCSGPAEQCMDPIPWKGSVAESLRAIKSVLESMPRTRIVTERDGYLHCEVRSRIFRFVDDLEFLVDPEARIIQFRSASRVGYSDLGVNRARMEEFQRRFAKSRSTSLTIRP